MRVVSHSCSNTEIVCALGCADFLVGIDDHSDHPDEVVARLSRVGPDLDVDVDRVAALRPDLVIASLTVPGHEKVVERLSATKLPLLVLEPKSLSDVAEDVEMVAVALGVEARGQELARRLRDAFVEPSPKPEERPCVLVEWWPKPVIVPGRKSWVTDMLRIAGARNPFGDRDVESTPITDDEAVAASPDAVVVSWCGVRPEKYRLDVVRERTPWGGTPALRNDVVVPIPEAWMGRPGPRLVEGIAALRAVAERCRNLDA